MSPLILQISIVIFHLLLNVENKDVSNGELKNVLLIMMDDFRPEIGVYEGEEDAYYRYIKTPNIDALAQESMVFTRAYTQVSVCAPSRASMLTGRRPDTTLVYSNLAPYWRTEGGNYTTIPQYFKENGYQTYGSGKIYHVGYNNDDAYSWSEPNYRPSSNIVYWYRSLLSWAAVDTNTSTIPLPDTAIKDNAIERLYQVANNTDTPFFIGVGFQKPHLPFVCPIEFFDMYPEEDIYLPGNPYAPVNLPVVAWSNWSDFQIWSDMFQYEKSINSTMPDNETLALRRAYYACVTYVDYLIGELLQEMMNLGLAENTIILFTSDHGYHLGEHGDWGKQTNFELDTRVPLMLRVPGVTDGGMTTESLVELIDIFPTLVQLAGLEPIEQCPEESFEINTCHEGHSMVDILNGYDEEWKSATFSQYSRILFDMSSMGYSIHTPLYHYVKWLGSENQTVIWDEVVAEELYDLEVDPNETINVANYPEYVDIQKEIEEKLLAGWREALPPPLK